MLVNSYFVFFDTFSIFFAFFVVSRTHKEYNIFQERGG
nr:MAG TPA: hypothetical protein [Caudoviricetes sp.]